MQLGVERKTATSDYNVSGFVHKIEPRQIKKKMC